MTCKTCLALVAMGLSLAAWAGPGAHGPNGEHLDGAANTASKAGTSPRMEARTEQFELVATLSGSELSMLIDRYATNEPVLEAQVEVESGGLKAKAPFHDDIGDYAVDDEKMLRLLASPGEHPLVITVIHGNESDLMEGTLVVTRAQDSEAHEHGPHARWPWVIAGALGLAATAAMVIRRQRRLT